MPAFVRSVIFTAGAPRKFLSGTTDQLNLNLAAGETWRVVAYDVHSLDDVPALETLAPHAELVEPASE